jgi:hypothetical protein
MILALIAKQKAVKTLSIKGKKIIYNIRDYSKV